MRLNMEITGLDKVESDLGGKSTRVLNLSPAYREIATDLRAVEKTAFDTGGSSTGKAWAPNAPWWAYYKRQHYPQNFGVLEMGSGKLMHSLTVANAPYARTEITNQSMTFGTTMGIARVLLKGGTRTLRDPRTGQDRRVRIPARPFLRTKARDRKRWAGYLKDWVASGEVRRGGGM